MIVKSVALEKEFVDSLSVLSSDVPYVIVVRPRKELRGLVKNAIRKQLYLKEDASAEYAELEAYYTSMCNDPVFVAEVNRSVKAISNYLTQGMIFRFVYQSLEDYSMTQCARLSALLVSTVCGGRFVDGCDLMACEDHDGTVLVDWQKSSQQIREKCASDEMVVVSGGYGRTYDGTNVKIGRGGSDLMATAIASVLGAERIEFYTKYDGIQGIPALTYEEAAHMMSTGDSPIFPPAMWPAIKSGIPIVVKNIFAPDKTGTVISTQGTERAKGSFTGIVTDTDLVLVTVYGGGLLGSVGMSSNLFSALARKGINIRFISQSSAEYSISFAVCKEDGESAMTAISELIDDRQYLTAGDILFVNKEVSIVSVCGACMRSVPGVSGRIYTALGDAGISIIAASQGGEEFSISLVVDRADTEKAVAALKSL